MVDRNRQALVILAEEGAIQEEKVELAEVVVRGEPEAIDGILVVSKTGGRSDCQPLTK
jgi:hypothetical protein